jgi:hypothetical protein
VNGTVNAEVNLELAGVQPHEEEGVNCDVNECFDGDGGLISETVNDDADVNGGYASENSVSEKTQQTIDLPEL